MTEEVRVWIQKENLIEVGDTVFVGVSGGADSVCLLLLLKEYQQEVPFTLRAIHVEHGIRGDESKDDARFVEQLCERLGVQCESYSVDVPTYAKEQHMGLEEAARVLRYGCFEEVASKTCVGAKKIALAHHADDNAETVLFQMVRGSGVRGLSGMRPMRKAGAEMAYIRPLLGVTREQIEKYLQDCGEDYRVDSTNQDIRYSRNYIRHQVMPVLKQINTQAVSHVTQSARQLGELADYVEGEASRIAKQVRTNCKDGYLLEKVLFSEYPVVLQKEVVYQTIGVLAGNRKDIANIHVETVCCLMDLQVGRMADLPYNLVAERVYEGIFIHKKSNDDVSRDDKYQITLRDIEACTEGEWYELPLEDGFVRMRVREFSGEINQIQKKTYTKWLNYDKIKCNLQFRKRACGDYLIIDEMGHRKKLKEYFIEEKVPREQRSDMWLLTEGQHVLWIVGRRISSDYKVNENTRKILEIQMSGGKYCEG